MASRMCFPFLWLRGILDARFGARYQKTGTGCRRTGVFASFRRHFSSSVITREVQILRSQGAIVQIMHWQAVVRAVH
jgi:hypothetical protein